MNDDELGYLHVYPLLVAKGQVRILGTPAGLRALRSLIDRALEHEMAELDQAAMAADGKAYGIQVSQIPESMTHLIATMQLPYLS